MTKKEIVESLKLLKEQAQKSHNDTAILNVKVESFVWVIESAIQALSQEPCDEQLYKNGFADGYEQGHKDTGIKLDEAIERFTNNAEFERTHGNLQGCLEFRQLAEWLRELKMYRHYLLKAEIEPQESEDKK